MNYKECGACSNALIMCKMRWGTAAFITLDINGVAGYLLQAIALYDGLYMGQGSAFQWTCIHLACQDICIIILPFLTDAEQRMSLHVSLLWLNVCRDS